MTIERFEEDYKNKSTDDLLISLVVTSRLLQMVSDGKDKTDRILFDEYLNEIIAIKRVVKGRAKQWEIVR